MEKIKEADSDDKILQYVAKEKLKMPPYRITQRKPSPEIKDEIQQKVISKALKQNQIMHLAEKEIGLETPKVLTHNNVTITFVNNTKFAMYIQNTRLDPKKNIMLKIALLKLTNRLSHFEIPIYAADTTQIIAGFGPILKYEKSNQKLAILEGIRSQIISERHDYEFYSKLDVTDAESEKKSNSIEDNINHYYIYVILDGKKCSNGTLALEAFLGSGASQYDAARYAQQPQDIVVSTPSRQLQEIVAHCIPQSRESIRPPSIATIKDVNSGDQSVIKDKDDETSVKVCENKNDTTLTRTILNSVPPQRPQGCIGISQSTTNVKSAFPSTKNESEQKTGSLIYGSLRRAIARTASIADFRDVKKEHNQPQEMKGNA